MRIAAIGAALVMCTGVAHAQAVDASKDKGASITVREAAARSGIQAARKGDCDTAATALDRALADGGGDPLPRALAIDAYEAATACAANSRDRDRAYRMAMAAIAKGGSSMMLWNQRLDHESRNSPDAVAVTIEAMAARAPDILNRIPLRWLSLYDNDLRDRKVVAARRRLLRVVTSPAYQPEEPVPLLDGFLQSEAEYLVADGRKADAAKLVSRIKHPSILLEMSFDPRFRAMLPADLDLRAAATRLLAEARTAMQDYPQMLNPILLAAQQQRMLGDAEGALKTLEIAGKVRTSAADYSDGDEQRNWWWDGLSRTYWLLGRPKDAEAALRSGSGAEENGGLNVSQLINLSQMQLATAPKEALATLAPFARPMPVSAYGAAEMRYARGCAYALTGDRTAAQADLAFLSEREKDHPEALTRLLLCMGEMDRAAAALIRRLEDPARLAQALALLSDFDAPPAAAPIDPITSRLPALKARPDVQAAIARAGGTRRIHLQGMEL
ncbi:MAG: hypothetical protein V4808_13000 [Pseudomonadota bacterium]